MEEKIGLILVLVSFNLLFWVIFFVGFLGVFVANKFRKTEQSIDFQKMWVQDRIEELVSLATRTLQSEPNNLAALVYGGRAMRKSGRLAEAKNCLERAAAIEPRIAELLQAEVEAIAEAPVQR